MRAEIRVKVGKELTVTDVDGKAVTVREVFLVGKPKLFLNAPRGFEEKKDKEFSLVVELTRSGTIRLVDVLDPVKAKPVKEFKDKTGGAKLSKKSKEKLVEA